MEITRRYVKRSEVCSRGKNKNRKGHNGKLSVKMEFK